MRLTQACVGALMTLAVFSASPAAASCTLPVPDGGGKRPSPPNVEGRISRTGEGFVDVSPGTGKPATRVEYTQETQFYSTFGGDYEPADLAVGQHVSVWFDGCRAAKNGAGHAAYLQLYSRDPADQPR
jgi:hypothetical protein